MDAITCAVEIRAVDGGGPGRISGVLMRYGEPARERREVFADGALEWPDDGIVLRRQHARNAPIMRVVPEVRGREVLIDAPLPDTAAGRDAAEEIRSGLLTGLSVEFRARLQSYERGRRVVKRALLSGAGLVDDPEYGAARVEVRRRERRIWL